MTTIRTGPALRPRHHRLARALLSALAGLAAVGALAQADPAAPLDAPQRLSYAVGARGVMLSIQTTQAAPVRVQQDGRDVLVSFADAVPVFDAAELQRRGAPWIEGVNVGYDSLLLRLASGVHLRVVSSSAALELYIDPSDEEQTLGGAGDGAPMGTLRLELLRAQLLLNRHELAAARERFTALHAALPGQSEPLLGLAAVEAQAARWRRSLALYDEAAALGGATEEAAGARAQVARAQASRASVGLEQRKTRGGSFDAPVDIRLGEAHAVQRLDEGWRLDLDVDVASVHTDAVRRADGSIAAFSGQRQRAALGAQYDAFGGAVSTATLLLGSSTAGAALSLRQPDDTGATQIVLEAGRPNWDYVEGLIDGALRHRLALARTQRGSTDLSARIEGGVNRYHAKGMGEVGRSNSLAGEVRWTQLGGVNGMALVYALDAEYVGARTTQHSAAGAAFSWLPLVDREVHTLTLGYARSTGERRRDGAYSFDGYAGLGRDRYGRSGEVAAATFSYARGALELRLRASHVRNVARSRGTSDTLGALLVVQL